MREEVLARKGARSSLFGMFPVATTSSFLGWRRTKDGWTGHSTSRKPDLRSSTRPSVLKQRTLTRGRPIHLAPDNAAGPIPCLLACSGLFSYTVWSRLGAIYRHSFAPVCPRVRYGGASDDPGDQPRFC